MSGRKHKAARPRHPQHPRQILNLGLTSLLRARPSARTARRVSLRDMVAARRVILPRDVVAGATRVETIGAACGTVGTVIFGGGGGGIFGGLVTPLGSSMELLRPPALPGLPTPAPGAWDVAGAARLTARTKAKNADLPIMNTLQREYINESRGLSFRFCVSRRRAAGAELRGVTLDRSGL